MEQRRNMPDRHLYAWLALIYRSSRSGDFVRHVQSIWTGHDSSLSLTAASLIIITLVIVFRRRLPTGRWYLSWSGVARRSDPRLKSDGQSRSLYHARRWSGIQPGYCDRASRCVSKLRASISACQLVDNDVSVLCIHGGNNCTRERYRRDADIWWQTVLFCRKIKHDMICSVFTLYSKPSATATFKESFMQATHPYWSVFIIMLYMGYLKFLTVTLTNPLLKFN